MLLHRWGERIFCQARHGLVQTAPFSTQSATYAAVRMRLYKIHKPILPNDLHITTTSISDSEYRNLKKCYSRTCKDSVKVAIFVLLTCYGKRRTSSQSTRASVPRRDVHHRWHRNAKCATVLPLHLGGECILLRTNQLPSPLVAPRF